jgi:outer membrane protein TolC
MKPGYFSVFVIAATMLSASGEWPQRPSVVQSLVAEAMAGNIALQTQAVDVEQARVRLDEARSLFQPRLDLLARYTRADGGRTIDLPIGDLLNPAYATLNQLLAAQGQSASFPQVANQSIPLLREREQETKLRLTQPLYRPEISRGAQARRASLESREASLAQFKRELRLQVESAYYRCRQTEAAVEILKSALGLTGEALRVNRLLFENDKVTEDRVLRAEADQLAVQQQSLEAERDRNLARATLNFLLNRPLSTPVPGSSGDELVLFTQAVLALTPPESPAPDGREELLALRKAIKAASAAEDAERARLYPSLALAVDAGTQGESYGTGRGYNFVQGSLVAAINLWDGRERRSGVQMARLERRKLELQLAGARQQISLEIMQAADELRSAAAACATAARRREASARAFEIVSRRELEGLASQLTFLDARNELTRAELNLEITRQYLLINAAKLDRAAALTPLP